MRSSTRRKTLTVSASVVVAVACGSEFRGGDGGPNPSSARGGRGGSSGEGGESAGTGVAGIGDSGGEPATGGSAGDASGGTRDPGTGGAGPGTGGNAGDAGGGAASGTGGSSSGGTGGGGASSGNAGASGASSGNAGSSGSAGTGGGAPGTRPSCDGMSPTACRGESCCTELPVPAQMYLQGRRTECPMSCPDGCLPSGTCQSDETPEHPTTISAFVLDKYEVTVGRFRRFVNAYTAWRAGGNPALGVGANPGSSMGWQNSWYAFLPASAAALTSSVKCVPYATYLDNDTTNDAKPINCLTFYVAHAFCAWDGGALPTEAQWEAAATGGSENRSLPWGDTFANDTLAVYGCRGNGDIACGLDDILPVGSKPPGAGRWGHLDLAGSVWEWTMDTYVDRYLSSCNDCVETRGSDRVARGGDWYEGVSALRAQERYAHDPSTTGYGLGVRCMTRPR